MRSILKRVPDVPARDYSESHQGRGQDYHETFTNRPGRSLMWDLEQTALQSFVQDLRIENVVDFACGTGRITQLLCDALPEAKVVGVDISESMLEVARTSVPAARFECIDGRDLSEKLISEDSVDLITAIRFFSNANSSLREAAIDQFTSALRPGGYAVVNNHRNFWSPSYMSRRLKKGAKAPGCLNRQVIDPFLNRGFKVLDRRSLGILPQSDDRSYLMPWRTTYAIESANLRRASSRHSAGLNTVWLLQKST